MKKTYTTELLEQIAADWVAQGPQTCASIHSMGLDTLYRIARDHPELFAQLRKFEPVSRTRPNFKTGNLSQARAIEAYNASGHYLNRAAATLQCSVETLKAALGDRYQRRPPKRSRKKREPATPSPPPPVSLERLKARHLRFHRGRLQWVP